MSTSALSSTSLPSPSKNKDWIAGAIIGPVFGAAVLGLVFWIYRRRHNVPRNRESQQIIVAGKSFVPVSSTRYSWEVSSVPPRPTLPSSPLGPSGQRNGSRDSFISSEAEKI